MGTCSFVLQPTLSISSTFPKANYKQINKICTLNISHEQFFSRGMQPLLLLVVVHFYALAFSPSKLKWIIQKSQIIYWTRIHVKWCISKLFQTNFCNHTDNNNDKKHARRERATFCKLNFQNCMQLYNGIGTEIFSFWQRANKEKKRQTRITFYYICAFGEMKFSELFKTWNGNIGFTYCILFMYTRLIWCSWLAQPIWFSLVKYGRLHVSCSRDSIRNSTIAFNAIEIELEMYRLISLLLLLLLLLPAAAMMNVFAIHKYTNIHEWKYIHFTYVSTSIIVA